jgi:hypothetical protein
MFANLNKRRPAKKQMTRSTRLNILGIGIGLLLALVIGGLLLVLNHQGRLG